MDREAFQKLPEELLVREIKFRIPDPACRVREVTLVTTLLDPERYRFLRIAPRPGLRRPRER
jgi:hypothetical protein